MLSNSSETSTVSSRNAEAHRLLFFSLEDWDQVWRRNQFICAELLNRFSNLELLWVSPPYDLSHDPKNFDARALKLIRSTDLPRMSVFKPLKLLPNVVGKRVNNFAMSRQLEGALRQLGWSDLDLWINDQKARNYLPKAHVRKSIYDVTDDWTQFEQPARVKNAVIADDAFLLDFADEIIVCSEWLYKKNSAGDRHVHLIPNGVDAFRYHPSKLANMPRPEPFKHLTRVAGYVGTMHSERLDLELIEQLALEAPDVTFLFIGPNCLDSSQTARLTRHQNVQLTGPIDYQKLPNYISCLDVCMTPHKVSTFTESLDPLKLYEYMSTGKPIVSTPCSGFRDLPQLVSIEAEAAGFAKAIERAIVEQNVQEQERVHWASEQTWQRRVDSVTNVLGW